MNGSPAITRGLVSGSIDGPAPLVRTNGDALEVKPAGLQLLSSLPQSSRIITVFAVGGSRAGKSTLGNSLLEGGVAFPTSNGFAPVTDGIDVATLVVDKNTALVYCDCEGSFHINASHTNPQSFGPMAVLAYVCTDYLAHVSMGNVDERDVQSLAFLAASATRREDDCKPKLLVIINNPRFSDLASDPTQVLAAAWEGTQFARDDPRLTTREALRSFEGPDFICLSDLQSSPQKYRQEVLNLKKTVIAGVGEAPPGRSTGPELAAFIDFVVSELNKAGSIKPEAAVDSVYRQLQLEPLIETLERDFVEKLRMQEPGPHALRHARYVHEALLEYDKKTSRMPASTSLKSGSRLALAKRLKRMQEIAKMEEENTNKENSLAQSCQLTMSSSTLMEDDLKQSVNMDDFARFYQRVEASERWLEEFENHLHEQTEWLEQALSSETSEFAVLSLPEITIPDFPVTLHRPFTEVEHALTCVPEPPEPVNWDHLFALASGIREEVEELQNSVGQGQFRSIGSQIEKKLANIDRQITTVQHERLSSIERLEKRRQRIEEEVRDTLSHERAERLHREAMSKQMIDDVVRWIALAKAR